MNRSRVMAYDYDRLCVLTAVQIFKNIITSNYNSYC